MSSQFLLWFTEGVSNSWSFACLYPAVEALFLPRIPMMGHYHSHWHQLRFFFFFTPTKHQAYGIVYSYPCQGFFYSHWPQSCSPKVCRAVNWPFCKSLENPDLLYREYVIPHPSFREHLSDNIYTHPAWRGCQPTFIFLSCIFVPPYPEGPHKPERAHQGENSQATSLLHVEEL